MTTEIANSANKFAHWFREVAPYIHAHRGCTFVLQFDSGAVDAAAMKNFIHDIALLRSIGVRLVLVFAVDRLLTQCFANAGITPKEAADGGAVIIDKQMLSLLKQVVGTAFIDLQALLSMGLPNSPMAGSALKISCGNVVTAKPLGIHQGIDHHYLGEVRRIDTHYLEDKLAGGDIVLIPPLGYSLTGEAFLLDAVRLSGEVASSLKADKLVFMNEHEGIRDREQHFLHELTCNEIITLLNTAGSSFSTKEKHLIETGVRCCESGTQRVHWVSATKPDGLLMELFSRDGAGTMLSMEEFDTLRAANLDDIPGILELITPYTDGGILADREREHIEQSISDYFVESRDRAIIACAALHLLADGKSAELACLAVHSAYRNQGRGKRLYRFVEQSAIAQGVKTLWARTTHAEHWLIECGFQAARESSAEVSLGSRPERNSRMLVKSLG